MEFDVEHYIDDGVIKYELFTRGNADHPCAAGIFRLRDLTHELIDAHSIKADDNTIVDADGYSEIVQYAQDLKDELDYVNKVIETNKHHLKGH